MNLAVGLWSLNINCNQRCARVLAGRLLAKPCPRGRGRTAYAPLVAINIQSESEKYRAMTSLNPPTAVVGIDLTVYRSPFPNLRPQWPSSSHFAPPGDEAPGGPA